MHLIGATEHAESLSPVLEELFARLDVAPRVRASTEALDPRAVLDPPADVAAALARIWIELEPERSTIYLVDGPWERILVRHVPAEGGRDEIHRESVGHICQAAVEALLAGATIGLTREQVSATLRPEPAPEPTPEPEPEPEPPVTPPPAPPPAPGFDLAADAALGWTAQLYAAGPEARNALTLSSSVVLVGERLAPFAEGVIDFWPTSRHEGAGVSLDLRTLYLRLAGGVQVELTRRWFFRASAGVALDITAVEPRQAVGTTDVAPARAWNATAVLFFLRAGAHHRIDWLVLGASALIDVDPVDTRYVLRAGDRDEVVLDPYGLRLGLTLTAGVAFR